MPRIEESRHCPAYSLPLLVVLLAVVLLVVTLLVSNGHSFCRRGVIHTPHTVEETTAVERSVSTVKREHNIYFFAVTLPRERVWGPSAVRLHRNVKEPIGKHSAKDELLHRTYEHCSINRRENRETHLRSDFYVYSVVGFSETDTINELCLEVPDSLNDPRNHSRDNPHRWTNHSSSEYELWLKVNTQSFQTETKCLYHIKEYLNRVKRFLCTPSLLHRYLLPDRRGERFFRPPFIRTTRNATQYYDCSSEE